MSLVKMYFGNEGNYTVGYFEGVGDPIASLDKVYLKKNNQYLGIYHRVELVPKGKENFYGLLSGSYVPDQVDDWFFSLSRLYFESVI